MGGEYSGSITLPSVGSAGNQFHTNGQGKINAICQKSLVYESESTVASAPSATGSIFQRFRLFLEQNMYVQNRNNCVKEGIFTLSFIQNSVSPKLITHIVYTF